METLFIEATAATGTLGPSNSKWALQVLMGNTARCCASAAEFAHGLLFCTCPISSGSCKWEFSLFFIHWTVSPPVSRQYSVVCPGKGGLVGTHRGGTSPGVDQHQAQGVWAVWAELKVIELLDSNTLLLYPWLFSSPKLPTCRFIAGASSHSIAIYPHLCYPDHTSSVRNLWSCSHLPCW